MLSAETQSSGSSDLPTSPAFEQASFLALTDTPPWCMYDCGTLGQRETRSPKLIGHVGQSARVSRPDASWLAKYFPAAQQRSAPLARPPLFEDLDGLLKQLLVVFERLLVRQMSRSQQFTVEPIKLLK